MAKRIVAKVGTYQKDGQTKGEYVKLGVSLTSQNGEYHLMDPSVNLAGVLIKQNLMAKAEGKPERDMVMVSVFDDADQPRQGASNQPPPQSGQYGQQAPQQNNSGFDDFERSAERRGGKGCELGWCEGA